MFASGTMRWVESMMAGRRGDGADHHISAAAGRFVTRVNTNLLLAFARGPAREHYPHGARQSRHLRIGAAHPLHDHARMVIRVTTPSSMSNAKCDEAF